MEDEYLLYLILYLILIWEKDGKGNGKDNLSKRRKKM